MLRKLLMLTSATLLLVSVTVGATLAYLTDMDAVTNTFTVGKVDISMDEARVDEYGQAIDAENDRVQSNTYHLIPGQTYDKDPTIYVTEDSEDCWLFVKVVNPLADIEDDTVYDNGKKPARKHMNTIAYQIAGTDESGKWENKGTWNPLTDENGNVVDGVYYKEHIKDAGQTKYPVFTTFTLKGEGLVNGTAGEGEISIDDYQGKQIEVTAYAIQKAGFDGDPYSAWVAGGWADTEADSENP